MTATFLILLIVSTSLFIITCFNRQWSYLVDVGLFSVALPTMSIGLNIGEHPAVTLISCGWIVVWIWWLWRKESTKKYFQVTQVSIAWGMFWGVFGGLITIAMALVFPWSEDIFPGLSGLDFYVFGLVFRTVVNATSEEFIFRLLFSNHLKQLTSSILLVILFQGLVFGLVHLPRYETYLPGLFYATCFGWFTGWLFHRQKSIWGVVLVHSLSNLMFILWHIFAH